MLEICLLGQFIVRQGSQPVEAADYQAAMDELRRIFLEAGQSGTALQTAWRAGRALAAGDIEALARGPSTV